MGLQTPEKIRTLQRKLYLKAKSERDWKSSKEIIEIAMSIEAKALDLYLRAANMVKDQQSREIFSRIADEERNYLKQLGKLISAW